MKRKHSIKDLLYHMLLKIIFQAASIKLSGHLPGHMSGHLPGHLPGHIPGHLPGHLTGHLPGNPLAATLAAPGCLPWPPLSKDATMNTLFY